MKTLFIVVNVDWFFLSHRKEIAIAAIKYGFNVTIVANDTGRKEEIKKIGLNFINLPLSKSGKNIFQEMRTIIFLIFLYRKYKPDIIHHVGLKTILYGTFAAKFVRVKSVVNAVSGLGILFSKERISYFSGLAIIMLRFTHKHKNLFVIFQNDEDKEFFLKHKIINPRQSFKIKGSGIDLNIFSYKSEIVSDKIYILFVSRMLKEKGVFELIEAANLLKERYIGKVQFLLCGGIDDNPNSLKDKQLNEISDGKYIKWLGYKTNVRELLEQSHIVTLPSYYREGLPKSLIEACAIGRPIVTTNSIGCKDAVIDGFNGFLVPVKNSKILAEKLEILINNKSLRISFGNNSRKYAEENFSIQEVIEKHIEIYNQLLM